MLSENDPFSNPQSLKISYLTKIKIIINSERLPRISFFGIKYPNF